MYGSSPILAKSVCKQGLSGFQERTLHHRHGIVVKYCRHVFGGKLVRGVAYQETSLSHCTVADDHASEEPSALAFSHTAAKTSFSSLCFSYLKWRSPRSLITAAISERPTSAVRYYVWNLRFHTSRSHKIESGERLT